MYRPFPTSVRIGDAEREAAASALNRHFAEGRLTVLEHDERVSLALAAQHSGDLDRLFADLPALGAPTQAPSPMRAGKRQRAAAAAGRFVASRALPIPVMILGIAFALFVFVHLLPFIIAGALVLFVVRGRALRRHHGAAGPQAWSGREFYGYGHSRRYGHGYGHGNGRGEGNGYGRGEGRGYGHEANQGW